MKRIRYLSLLVLLLSSIGIWAQGGFDPTNPDEPGPMTTKLKVLADPENGGSVSGGGSYVAGQSASLHASPSSGYKFVNWTDAAGNEVSKTASFSYIKQNRTETLVAHFVFAPDSPSEPPLLPTKLTLVAEVGGYVSGGGYYREGTEVHIYASANSGFDFMGWYYDDGTLYSEKANADFVMLDHAVTLTAKFQYNPENPSEPGDVNSLHLLKLVATDGGTASVSGGARFIREGSSVRIYANPNSGYEFEGWYDGETKLSELEDYMFPMPTRDVTLTARFVFMPQSPNEPDELKQRTFSFTLYNVNTKPGMTAEFPILLTPRETLKDMTFQLHFREELNVDMDKVVLGETTQPYQMATEDLGIEDGMHSYKFTLTGGMMEGANVVVPILTFPIIIPEDAETATAHQIKINQIVMTNEDGSTQTAGTRNGRVSIYKNGDANGDNSVSITDAVTVVNHILGNPQEVFIDVAANTNDDGDISISDVVGVVNIILDENTTSAPQMDAVTSDVEPD